MKIKREFALSKSIFSRTALMFSLMSAVTLIVMFLFVNGIITRNQEKHTQTLTIGQIDRLTSDLDTRIEAITQSMSRFLYSADTISLMVKADITDLELAESVVRNLDSLVNENPLISEAVFYLPTRDIVFSTSGSSDSANFITLSEYKDREWLENYLENRADGRDGSEDVRSLCRIRDGQLYMSSDFCVPYFIGAVLVTLDTDVFMDIVQGTEDTDNGRYFVYQTAGGEAIASSSRREEIVETLLAGNYYNVTTDEGLRKSQIYVQQSEQMDLLYGVCVDAEQGAAWGQLLLTFLPFLLCYGVFAFFYSAYISRSIYQPINRLMEITVSRRAELDEVRRDRSRDEMEYLEKAFRDTWGENRQNRELLSNISDDMLEQLFRNIISGRSVSEGYVKSTLQGLGLESIANGRYVALAGFMSVPVDREQSSMETGMYRRSLMTFVDEYQIEDSQIQGFFVDQTMMAIAVCFRDEVSATQIRRLTADLVEALEKFAAPLPFSLMIGVGKTYSNMDGLYLSFQEANDQVDYQRYVSDDGEEELSVPNMLADHDKRYFIERATQLAEAAEKERRENAEQIAASVIGDILSVNPEKWQSCITTMIDILVEKMISVHVPADEMKLRSQAMEKASAYKDKDTLEERLNHAVYETIRSIHASSRKSRYRYVDVAKEYIESHYADGNLTLNEVSDAVGISAPYLSGIFAESEEIGFSAYLSNYRVEQAKQFLERTTMSVTDIGYKCGFNSSQSFSRVFKKNTGFTPGQYREYVNDAKDREG